MSAGSFYQTWRGFVQDLPDKDPEPLPEEMLLRAIVSDALDYLRWARRAKDSESVKSAIDDYDWMFSDEHFGGGIGFVRICEFLDEDHDSLRRYVLGSEDILSRQDMVRKYRRLLVEEDTKRLQENIIKRGKKALMGKITK